MFGYVLFTPILCAAYLHIVVVSMTEDNENLIQFSSNVSVMISSVFINFDVSLRSTF